MTTIELPWANVIINRSSTCRPVDTGSGGDCAI